MRALLHDMIGYAITVGGKNTMPTFGAEPRYAANPHVWAVSTSDEPPFVLGISSAAVAAHKMGLARQTGAMPLPGTMAAEDGTPFMEEQATPEHT